MTLDRDLERDIALLLGDNDEDKDGKINMDNEISNLSSFSTFLINNLFNTSGINLESNNNNTNNKINQNYENDEKGSLNNINNIKKINNIQIKIKAKKWVNFYPNQIKKSTVMMVRTHS